MRYIYGPVHSRRLGSSLGLSLTPHKLCDFDCVYCQLGKTFRKVLERKEYFKIEDILAEGHSWFVNNPEQAKALDFITISGSGEPTLNSGIGLLIESLKKTVAVPVAVITNSSLLGDPVVRRQILGANLIVPSLDAVTEEAFQKIDRPCPEIKLEEIIEGLVSLRKEFKGQIWLEVMLVKGINDNLAHTRRLKEVIERINPDKIQLNSPVRFTAEEGAEAVDAKHLEKIKELLGDKCEVI
ncbi:MAG: radical SAM protein [Candidatus Omnitrophica bacterium]|nr:radical SAM protein [Candidatus Omnitrophota bacterium]